MSDATLETPSEESAGVSVEASSEVEAPALPELVGTSREADPIQTFLLSLEDLNCNSFSASFLNSIVHDVCSSDRTYVTLRLSGYIDEIFGCHNTQQLLCARRQNTPRIRNRRAQRRHEYATVQRNWQKHSGRCIKSILDDCDSSSQPPREVMEPYWRNIFEVSSDMAPPDDDLGTMTQGMIWKPILGADIRSTKPSLSTSPGVDGITARQIRAIPEEVLLRVMNLVLWCGVIPRRLRAAKTIFLPKKSKSELPEDFRPITMPSILVRWIHAILAKRIAHSIKFERTQKGFMPTDGCADNTTIIDLLLRGNHSNFTSCYIAVLDVRKAFDSVSHGAILGTLRSYNLESELIRYVENLYADAPIFLSGSNWISDEVFPGRGVRQGDPLSPVLFNMIMDRLIRRLPPEIGCRIGNQMTNNAAYADDLVIWASTPLGLQKLIDIVDEFLRSCGLSLNSSKCFTVSLKGQPKQKRTLVEQRSFTIGELTIPSLKRTDEWKYLGVTFSAEGRIKVNIVKDISQKLDLLTRAPLKPQQRLFALRTVLIPQFYHVVSLGNIMIGTLNKADKVIRARVRHWLHLPNDIPVAYFHASVEDGGLGIVALRWQAPLARLNRLRNLQLPLDGVVTANVFIAAEVAKVERRLRAGSIQIDTSSDLRKYWADRLYTSIDGCGLRGAGDHGQAHRWLKEPTRLLSGRDFVGISKLRINALPTRSRCARGRHQVDRRCRKGCDAQETLNHVLQRCRASAMDRTYRHDSVVKFLHRGLINRGFTVFIEEIIQTTSGIVKPDIVALKGDEVYVLDVQVVTDGFDLPTMHDNKANKYNTSAVKAAIKDRFATEKLHFCPITITWRGIWCRKSVNELTRLGIIKGNDSMLISTRVLIGGVMTHRYFQYPLSLRTNRLNRVPRSFRTGIG